MISCLMLTIPANCASRQQTDHSTAIVPAMISRYARPVMSAIWASENKYRLWLEIELCAAEAMEKLGHIPAGTARSIREKAVIYADRIAAIETETKHDVIAFLTSISEQAGPPARFLHKGMTSSDILDTCFNMQLAAASDILLDGLDRVLAALKKRAFEHKWTPTIGRSHGIHAEPTTFGIKLAGFYAEFARNRARLVNARQEIATCAISGAVGTFANVDPRVEAYVSKKLGLSSETVSTQIIPRDRHAVFFATLAIIASSIERLATEIRHLQRTELLEAEEYFAQGQKGSSAMPHKRNPVLSENLTGLARLIRMAVVPALENVALWHERDISHSAAERGIGPDTTIHLDFALHRLTNVIENLVIHKDRMQEILDSRGGLHNSQRVLLALVEAGCSREESYHMVQRNALQAWSGNGSFPDLLKTDRDVTTRLPADTLEDLFNDDYHFKHVDHVFERVFGNQQQG